MDVKADIKLRLSAQRALTTHVTASLRAVSFEIHHEKQEISARYVFDGPPDETVWDAIMTMGGEVMGDYVSPWSISEEVVASPWPEPIENLRLVVYRRCEDDWVRWREDAAKVGRAGSSEHEA